MKGDMIKDYQKRAAKMLAKKFDQGRHAFYSYEVVDLFIEAFMQTDPQFDPGEFARACHDPPER